MEKNKTATRIREMMDELGLSQTALAKDLTERGYPITQSAISHILSTGKVSVETLKIMSNVYNKPVGWLTGSEEGGAEPRKENVENSATVEALQQTIKTLSEMLEMWKQHYQNLKDSTDDLRKDAELFRSIVKKAHDDGTLSIQSHPGQKNK